MPRKAPNQVIEHRISFSDYERRELNKHLDKIVTADAFKHAPNIMLGVAGLGMAGMAGVLLYWFMGWDWFSDEEDEKILAKAARAFNFYAAAQPPGADRDWIIFGAPKDESQMRTMYAQNRGVLNDRLQRAEEQVALLEQAPSWARRGGVGATYTTSKKYILSGYEADYKNLENWRLYYNEKLEVDVQQSQTSVDIVGAVGGTV